MTSARRHEALKGLSEALRRMRLAFPASANSGYHEAFARIDLAQGDVENVRAGLVGVGLQPVRHALAFVRGLFPEEASFQLAFRDAEMLLNALLESE